LYAVVLAFLLTWFYFQKQYEQRYDEASTAMASRYEKNNEVLLELDKLKREITTSIHTETKERLFIIENSTRSYNNRDNGCVIAIKK